MAADSCWIKARSSATVWKESEIENRGWREKTGLACSDALDERWMEGEESGNLRIIGLTFEVVERHQEQRDIYYVTPVVFGHLIVLDGSSMESPGSWSSPS